MNEETRKTVLAMTLMSDILFNAVMNNNKECMDYTHLDKGQDWIKLPNTYVIFITENDVLGGDLPIYHINRHIEELNYKPYGDCAQIIYVNGAYEVKEGEEKTALMTLIEDFRCSNADNMKSEVLAARMRQIKNSEEKMSDMCKEVEKFAEKKAMERTVHHIRNMMKNLKLTAEAAMEALEIPKGEYSKYMAML